MTPPAPPALTDYVRHLDVCDIKRGRACSCGLLVALAALAPPPTWPADVTDPRPIQQPGTKAPVPPAAAPPPDAGLVALVRQIQATVAAESAKGLNWSWAQQELLDKLLSYPLPARPTETPT